MAVSTIKNRTLIKKHYTASITCGANTYGYATATALNMSTPSGYTPVAVSAFSSDSNSPVYAVSSLATGAQGAVWVRNITSTTRTFDVSLDVLYAPSSIVG